MRVYLENGILKNISVYSVYLNNKKSTSCAYITRILRLQRSKPNACKPCMCENPNTTAS